MLRYSHNAQHSVCSAQMQRSHVQLHFVDTGIITDVISNLSYTCVVLALVASELPALT